MKSFEYKIKDELGIHARPAGMLAKIAKKFRSEILIESGNKKLDARKLMLLMSLGIKCGETIKITISGEDEEEACAELTDFITKNL